jgi:hypothetical protein
MMDKIIYYSEQNNNIKEIKGVLIEKTINLRQTIMFFLNNQDASGFIFDIQKSIEDNKKVLQLINKFNPGIPVIIIADEKETFNIEEYKKWNQNILWAKNFDEVSIVYKPFINKRKFYRINWPLNIEFSETFELKNSLKGKILTLSVGGAYVKSNDTAGLKKDMKLICRLEFSLFYFLVESKVVRVINTEADEMNPAGFAVQFFNISEATKNCINRVINDEVVSTLFSELNIALE